MELSLGPRSLAEAKEWMREVVCDEKWIKKFDTTGWTEVQLERIERCIKAMKLTFPGA